MGEMGCTMGLYKGLVSEMFGPPHASRFIGNLSAKLKLKLSLPLWITLGLVVSLWLTPPKPPLNTL